MSFFWKGHWCRKCRYCGGIYFSDGLCSCGDEKPKIPKETAKKYVAQDIAYRIIRDEVSQNYSEFHKVLNRKCKNLDAPIPSKSEIVSSVIGEERDKVRIFLDKLPYDTSIEVVAPSKKKSLNNDIELNAVQTDPVTEDTGYSQKEKNQNSTQKVERRAHDIISFSNIIRSEPDCAYNYYTRGKLYFESGEIELANKDFLRSVFLAPDDLIYQEWLTTTNKLNLDTNGKQKIPQLKK